MIGTGVDPNPKDENDSRITHELESDDHDWRNDGVDAGSEENTSVSVL